SHSGSLLFFFQAEDGIRDSSVTGVQTCALPISRRASKKCRSTRCSSWARKSPSGSAKPTNCCLWRTGLIISSRVLPNSKSRWPRSEERRVGKECRSVLTRWHPEGGCDRERRQRG